MQTALDQNGFPEQPALTKQNLSFWMLTQQRRRRKRLSKKPVLLAVLPTGLKWTWQGTNPVSWKIEKSTNNGATWAANSTVAGSIHTASGLAQVTLYRISGLNGAAARVTNYSNSVLLP